MKRLTATAMALLLATGASTVLADRDWDDGGHHGYHGHHGKHYVEHYVHYYPHYRPRYYYYSPRYYYDPYLPLGAALVGAAVGYSLNHSDDGVRVYESHSPAVYSSSSRVVGCYRIEHYPDGSEHRVELPPSDCY